MSVLLGWAALAVTLGLGRFAWTASGRRARVRRQLHDAARELGLRTTDSSWLSGQIDGFHVEAGPFGLRAHAELRVESVSRRGARIPLGLALRSVTIPERLRDQADVQTGDEPFDNALLLQGQTSEVLAVLDAPTRRIIDEALTANLRVADGVVCRQIARESLIHDVRRSVGLARRLTLSSESIPDRLAQHAREDPLYSVRLRNLEALIGDYPNTSHARQALRALLKDVSPEVRLRAALEMKSRGYSTLARLIPVREAGEEIAIKAFDVLVAHLPEKRLWPIVDSALRQPSPWLRERGLNQALKLGGVKAVTRLARLLADKEAEIAVQAAQAIERRGSASCEPALIKALSVEDLRLRSAAARALGRVGTAAAVIALREVIAGAGVFLLEPDLARTVHDAIRKIQSRLPGAEAGQLSLARSADTGGEVSLAAAAGEGDVALADAPVPTTPAVRRSPRRRKAAQ